jgi:hypothetical protein
MFEGPKIKFDNCYCFENLAGSEIKTNNYFKAGNFPMSDNQSIKTIIRF